MQNQDDKWIVEDVENIEIFKTGLQYGEQKDSDNKLGINLEDKLKADGYSLNSILN